MNTNVVGLPTTDGGVTVPGRVLRSDNLQTLSADDVRRLVEEIGLREVIDLRTTAEILLEGRSPLRDVEGVTHRHFSLIPERGHHTDVFAVEEDELVEGLPADWVESLLPRQAAAHDQAEPTAQLFASAAPDRFEPAVHGVRGPEREAERDVRQRVAVLAVGRHEVIGFLERVRRADRHAPPPIDLKEPVLRRDEPLGVDPGAGPRAAARRRSRGPRPANGCAARRTASAHRRA